jgi:AGZA family xanthine/uracil permease-like MFS transporter
MRVALPSMIDRYFAIAASGSTVPRELRAGLTTFLTMSYVLVVNPAVLGNAIAIPDAFAKLLVVTAIAAAVGSLLMGIVARYPFAQAPGMGLNAYFAFSVVLGQKIPWQTALGAVAISGTLFVLLSVIGVRQAIVRAVPQHLKLSITAGIGMFLAFIGLKNAGLIITSPATFVTLGSFASSGALIAIAGLVITAVLIVRRAPGAILIGIVASTVIAIATRAHVYVGPHDTFVPFGGFAHGLLALPVAPTDLIGALDVRAALGLGVASVVFTFFFVDFFDATGTLVALANKAGLLDARGELPRSRRTFAMDDGVHRKRERHRRRRPHRPRRRYDGRAVPRIDRLVAARRRNPRGRNGARAHHRRRVDARRLARDRLGRLSGADFELSHRDHDAAELFDR